MKIHNAHARKATTRSDFFFNYFTLGLVGEQGTVIIDVFMFCFVEDISSLIEMEFIAYFMASEPVCVF